MKSYKWKLASIILVEIESAKESTSVIGSDEMIKMIATDAEKLAKIVLEEEEMEERKVS